MRIVSFTEARNSLKAVLDSVLTDADTAVITRRDAEADKQIAPEVQRSPFTGIGKPEALKENLTSFWSRRIDDTNHLVYAIDDNAITAISCRYHY